MISFKKYYLQQFKDVSVCWKLAKKHKKYGAFIAKWQEKYHIFSVAYELPQSLI